MKPQPSLDDTQGFVPQAGNGRTPISPAISAGSSPTLAPSAGTGAPTPKYFGDYEILEKLGGGGMGVVFKARQKSLNRLVALKLIRAGELAESDEVRRFQSEAEAAAQLDHVNIVPVYEVGQQNGQHFFSMGYVEGPTLAQQLADGPLSPRTAADLARQLALAIQYAHERGVVHRDLKPANVLLTDRPAAASRNQASAAHQPGASSVLASPQTAIPKITDFGLAKRLHGGSDLTQSGQILGTPSYMPPEQAAGENEQVGPPADIYSLGAVMYCLLTGRPPFQAANPMETLRQVQEEEPVRPRHLNAAIPLDLETITLKCLQKEPRRRYASAHELADDLSRYLAGQPVVARPVGGVERVWRWCRRKPLATALIAAAAALVLLSAAAGWYRAQLLASDALRNAADRERQTANQQREAAEAAANLSRHYGLLNGVREAAANPKPGWTWAALDDLKSAAEFDKSDVRTLRNLAIRCLQQPDVRPEKTLKPAGAGRLRAIAFDPEGKRLAVGKLKGGTELEVFVYDVDSSQQVRRLAVSTLADSVGGFLSGEKKFQEGVRSLAWSPGGQQLAVGTRLGKIHVWNLAESEAPPVSWKAAGDAIDMLSWLTHDPTLLLAGTDTGARLWKRADAWREVGRCDDCYSAAISTNGTGVVSRGQRFRGLHVPGLTERELANQDVMAGRLVFAPGLDLVAVESDDRIFLLDGRTGEVLATLRDENSEARPAMDDLQFSPRGDWLFAMGEDRRLRCWDVGQRKLAFVTRAFSGESPQLSCDAAGRRLAIIADEEVQLLELRTGLDRRLALQLGLDAAALSSDGQRLATLTERVMKTSPTTFEHRLTFWNCATGSRVSGQNFNSRDHAYQRPVRQEASLLQFTAGGARVTVASPDLGPYVVSTEYDLGAMLWLELPDGVRPRVFEETELTAEDGRALSGGEQDPLAVDGRALALRRDQATNRAAWWRGRKDSQPSGSTRNMLFARVRFEQAAESGEMLRLHYLKGDLSPATAALLSSQVADPGYHWYQLTRFENNKLERPEGYSTKAEITPECRGAKALFVDQLVAIPYRDQYQVAFRHVRESLDGSKYWGVMEGDRIVVWNAATGRLMAQWKNLHSAILSGQAGFDSLAVAGDFAVAGCRDGNLFVLTVAADGKSLEHRTVDGREPIASVAISADQSLIAVGTRSGQLRLVNWPAGTVAAQWEAHAEDVSVLVFGSDAKRLYSGSRDGQLRTWALVSESGQSEITTRERLAIGVGTAPISSISLSVDGQSLLVLSQGDLSARLFNLETLERELDEVTAP